MRVYTYSQARQNLAEVLDRAKSEVVLIRRRGGDTFQVSVKPQEGSPLDVPTVQTQATTEDILSAVREVRERNSD